MVWTTPNLSWNLGTTPSAALFNQYIRDQENSLRAGNDANCRLYKSANQSIPNNTRTAVTWDAVIWGTGITLSSSQLTVPTTGYYMIGCNAAWASNSSGQRIAGWRLNGGSTNYDLQAQDNNTQHICTGQEIIWLTAGNFIEMMVFQNSGGALNLNGGNEGLTTITLRLMGSGTKDPPLWLPPRTWADGDRVTKTMLDTEIRDKFDILRYMKGAAVSLFLDEDVSVSSEVREPITWGQKYWGVGGMWTNGSQIVAPYRGAYIICANLEYDDDTDVAGGERGVGYVVNGKKQKNDLQFGPGSANTLNVSGLDILRMKKGDYLEVYPWQDTGESLTLHGGTRDRTRIQVALLAGR